MDKKLNEIIVFRGKNIRRIWYKDKWFFSIVDIIEVLSESPRPRKYWSDLKVRLMEEGSKLSEKIGQLKLKSSDGKYYLTDCADTESIFRIIQSIPSKKAEPFKRWLARVGYERVQEIENPELVQERMKELYGQKGYSKDWIDKRLRGIAIRQKDAEGFEECAVAAKQGGEVAGNARKEAEYKIGRAVVSEENYLDLNEKRKKKKKKKLKVEVKNGGNKY